MTSLTRRAVLGLSAGSALAVAGCSDPRIVGGPPTPPGAEPTDAIAGLDESAAAEAELLAVVEALVRQSAALRLPSAQASVARTIQQAGTTHLTALRSNRPTQRPSQPPVVPTPGVSATPRPAVTLGPNSTQALAATNRALEAAESAHRTAGLAAQGAASLLFGSLAAYARGATRALAASTNRPAADPVPVRELAVWDEDDALTKVLEQTYAVIFGHQVAAGRLSGAAARTATDQIARHRALRDRLRVTLRDRGRPTPEARASYDLPLQPRDEASARELLWRLELGFTRFCGPWLASARAAEVRQWAYEELLTAVGLQIDWGGPMPVWPGWPD